jgi:chromosome segregation ATPase
MCKKIAIVAVAVVAGLILLSKTNLGSYVGFSWKKGKEFFQQAVPPEVEVERLRHELTQLDPEIKKARSTLAEEAVNVEMLREDVEKTRLNLHKRQEEILLMKRDVESGKSEVNYGGRTIPVSRVRTMLAADWDAYKRAEEALKSKEKLLEAKEIALAEGQKQLADMTGLKGQLQAELDRVEADLKTVRLAQTRNNIQIDNTRITRFNNSLNELKRRIRVEKKDLDMQAISASHPIEVGKPVDVTAKALEEINARFSDKVAAEK